MRVRVENSRSSVGSVNILDQRSRGGFQDSAATRPQLSRAIPWRRQSPTSRRHRRGDSQTLVPAGPRCCVAAELRVLGSPIESSYMMHATLNDVQRPEPNSMRRDFL
jgi:hypothetical protein